jgi:nucleoid-associated protein YgaU
MDYSLKHNLNVASLFLAMILVSACSHSKVDSADGSVPETAAATDASKPAEAGTDAVPPPVEASATDPNAPAVAENPNLAQQPAPGALDANANLPPSPDAALSPPPADGVPAPVADAAPAPVADVAPAPVVEQKAEASVAQASTPVSGEVKQYKVKSGDTLMKIAFESYGDLYRWKDIYDGNRNVMKSPTDLAPGTVLTLSGAGAVSIERNGDRYLIKKGDTLGLISNDVYGTKAKWKKLWENNRQLIKNPNRIYAGFNLYYVPEARLTNDKADPAPVKDGGSASNQPLPFKGKEVAPQVANAPAAVTEAARTPASKK